jgi:arylsulfatase A-like enzyme
MRIFLIAVFICLSNSVQVLATPQRPNIVVIMTDDQNDTGDMAVMRKTLRALADEGVTFTNSFTNFPLCCPSRASFLTGQAATIIELPKTSPHMEAIRNLLTRRGKISGSG